MSFHATIRQKYHNLALAAILTGITSSADASSFTFLKQGFGPTPSGHPTGALYRDATGALYGALYYGGQIFKLTPPAAGKTKWVYSTLYAFKGQPDASFPLGSLVADAKGNLYGVAISGGSADSGAIYELSPPAPGQTAWTEQVIWSNPLVGAVPSILTIDKHGVLTTIVSTFLYNEGQVVRIAPPPSGQTQWSAATIYSLAGATGTVLLTGLVPGPKNSFYLSNEYGGVANDGTLVQIAPTTSGLPWSVQREYDFTGSTADGHGPVALTLSAGVLYGGAATTANTNTVIQAKPTKNSFVVKVIYNFTGEDSASSLLANPAGGFFGSSHAGGPAKYWGFDFMLTPPAVGQTTWPLAHLHDFAATDGSGPGPLIKDGTGTLYGATFYGKGASNNGVIYSIAP